MLIQYRKIAFSFIALLAVMTSMFKTNVDDAILSISTAAHKPIHSTKTAITGYHSSTVILGLEADSEEADGEDADDEIDNLFAEFELYTHFDFSSFRTAVAVQSPVWDESSVKGYSPPLYLINRNFRL